MSADGNTAAALTEVSTSLRFFGDRVVALEKEVKSASTDVRTATRELHSKIDAHTRDENAAMSKFNLFQQSTAQELRSHDAMDASRFNRLWWALGVGGSVVVAVLLKLVFK